MVLCLTYAYVTNVLCSSVTLSSKPMFLRLTQKPHPVRRPPLCRRGAGGEAVYHRERENQINTLVLKDINFTINIIELSYYRTIDTLNQSKMLPWYIKRKPPKRKPPQAPPREGMSLIRSHISSRFKLYPIRTSPPLEGLGEASLRGLLPCLWSSVVFTPLSIRRGGGGEAFLLLRCLVRVVTQSCFQFYAGCKCYSRFDCFSLKGFFI